MDLTHCTLRGQGHWSALSGDNYLASDLWIWWIEIEGVTVKNGTPLVPDALMFVHALQGKRGVAFIKRLTPELPRIANERVDLPQHIPGDSINVEIPLKECLDCDAVHRLILEYFPGLVLLIAS